MRDCQPRVPWFSMDFVHSTAGGYEEGRRGKERGKGLNKRETKGMSTKFPCVLSSEKNVAGSNSRTFNRFEPGTCDLEGKGLAGFLLRSNNSALVQVDSGISIFAIHVIISG